MQGRIGVTEETVKTHPELVRANCEFFVAYKDALYNDTYVGEVPYFYAVEVNDTIDKAF